MLWHHICREAAGQINDSQDLVVPPWEFESQLFRLFHSPFIYLPSIRYMPPTGIEPLRVFSLNLLSRIGFRSTMSDKVAVRQNSYMT